MPTVLRTQLRTTLAVVRTRLGDVTGLPAERIIWSQRDEPPFNAMGDSYLVLRVEGGVFDQGNILGGGRIDARIRIGLSVTAHSRLALDEGDRDRIWLEDSSLGNLHLVDQVLDALLCFQPLDSSGNWLVTEPMKPGKTMSPAKDRKNREWGESTVWFDLTFELALDQTYQ